MDRPMFITPNAIGHRAVLTRPAVRRGPLGAGVGARVLGHAVAALAAFGLFGYSAGMLIGVAADGPVPVGPQYGHALAILLGSLAALTATFAQLRRTAPTALQDRSLRGCAWFGASDAAISHAFLIGGALAFLQVLVLPAPNTLWSERVTPPFADWQLLPAMLHAFAVIALAPVAEELLLHGVMFATLRTRYSTLFAAIVVTVGFTVLHIAQIGDHPLSVVGTVAVGSIALALRLRHASLAPAIALHCGFNFTVCVAAALG